ncbi:MAG: serine--tRNA ligase [Gemmatimonadetes bacterium]|nr:serine--tRNA ligase [Gemmatimonadota bacterium]
MLDIRRLRSDPDGVKEALGRRDPAFGDLVDRTLDLDREWRSLLAEVNSLKAERNRASKLIGELRRRGEDASELIVKMRTTGDLISRLDVRIRDLEGEIRAIMLTIPNTPLDAVPPGGEGEGVVLREWGEPRVGELRPHWQVGEPLGLDLARGSRVSGSGFPVLGGGLARLQRALISYFIDVHVREHGYTELRIPYLVTTETMTGTGQLPKFNDESYATERDDLWLIPTAEVPVTNLHRGELLAATELPVRYVAYSPCFRREAGAAGKDTRGLLRVHQFDKVELVRYETPEASPDALDLIVRQAEILLERLGVRYRRVLLPGGDLGASGAMTYDLEAWAPGVERWLEVSSCTTFTDYQARRANLRYRERQGEPPHYLHTLNGSALALPRVMAVLLEQGQRADGTVELPAVIHPYFGADVLGPSHRLP